GGAAVGEDDVGASLGERAPECAYYRRLHAPDRRPDAQRDGLEAGTGATRQREQLYVPTLCRQPVDEQAAEDLGAAAGVGGHEHIDSRRRLVQIAQRKKPLGWASLSAVRERTSRPIGGDETP